MGFKIAPLTYGRRGLSIQPQYVLGNEIAIQEERFLVKPL